MGRFSNELSVTKLALRTNDNGPDDICVTLLAIVVRRRTGPLIAPFPSPFPMLSSMCVTE